MITAAKKFSALLPITALIASALVLGQTAFILLQGDPLCLNQGCTIVEEMTTVPPLLFNLAGLFFFQIIFWAATLVNRGVPTLHPLTLTLLTAAMAAEALLISFQHAIARTFCSYCLTICGFVVLLNLLAGRRQFLRGVMVFLAVTAAFFSVDFQAGGGTAASYTDGVFASRKVPEAQTTLRLFFSSHCSHCENIIQLLASRDDLEVDFHPIDQVEAIDVPGVEKKAAYAADANRDVLQVLGITEVPVLMVEERGGLLILEGEEAIQRKIDALLPLMKDQSDSLGQSIQQTDSLIPNGNGMTSDGCSVEADCVEGQATPFNGQPPRY